MLTILSRREGFKACERLIVRRSISLGKVGNAAPAYQPGAALIHGCPTGKANN